MKYFALGLLVSCIVSVITNAILAARRPYLGTLHISFDPDETSVYFASEFPIEELAKESYGNIRIRANGKPYNGNLRKENIYGTGNQD